MTAKEFIKSKQNDVLLNDYTLQETEWFMTEFAKQKQCDTERKYKYLIIELLMILTITLLTLIPLI